MYQTIYSLIKQEVRTIVVIAIYISCLYQAYQRGYGCNNLQSTSVVQLVGKQPMLHKVKAKTF